MYMIKEKNQREDASGSGDWHILMTDLVAAQPRTATLGQAVQRSVEKYPAVRGSLEQVSAAAAGTTWPGRPIFHERLPRPSEPRHTHNVFGLLLPNPLFPSISGPAQGTNSLSNIWGSAVGTLVSWEPSTLACARQMWRLRKQPETAQPPR